MTQEKTKIILAYRGNLTFETIEEILVQFKEKIDPFNIETLVQKRIYSILVECLENTYRHNIAIKKNQIHAPVELLVSTLGAFFEIRVGNYVNTAKVAPLTERIKEINSLDQNGLNNLYRESISKARISDKGGAGLGIIEIARNSRQKIAYEIASNEGNNTFFSFIVLVNKTL